MRRLHLFEWEDFSWFPSAWRDAGTSFLELAVRVSGHARLLAPKVEEVLRATGHTRLVDLCAGGGGPLPIVVSELATRGLDARAVLTDLYPNLPAFTRVAAASQGRITFHPEPVDATRVPPELDGLRVIFNAFHHLRPDAARAVLGDAARSNQPIAVFEVVSREPLSLLALLLVPLNFIFSLPFLRPFRFSWLFWTFVIPVLPLFVLWDGVVSWLRIYSPPELQALTRDIEVPDGWTWETGKIRLGKAPVHATWLVGRPRRSAREITPSS
jgi:hypothetical protein